MKSGVKLSNIVKSGLIVSVFSLWLSGCGSDKEMITTKVIVPALVYCPEPNKPTYEKLDEDKPLTDAENLEKLLVNITKQKYYIEGLKTTIECYKKQVKQVNELSEKTLHLQK